MYFYLDESRVIRSGVGVRAVAFQKKNTVLREMYIHNVAVTRMLFNFYEF
jgi:hypothetical protein